MTTYDNDKVTAMLAKRLAGLGENDSVGWELYEWVQESLSAGMEIKDIVINGAVALSIVNMRNSCIPLEDMESIPNTDALHRMVLAGATDREAMFGLLWRPMVVMYDFSGVQRIVWQVQRKPALYEEKTVHYTAGMTAGQVLVREYGYDDADLIMQVFADGVRFPYDSGPTTPSNLLRRLIAGNKNGTVWSPRGVKKGVHPAYGTADGGSNPRGTVEDSVRYIDKHAFRWGLNERVATFLGLDEAEVLEDEEEAEA